MQVDIIAPSSAGLSAFAALPGSEQGQGYVLIHTSDIRVATTLLGGASFVQLLNTERASLQRAAVFS